jgi:hypothetical protein
MIPVMHVRLTFLATHGAETTVRVVPLGRDALSDYPVTYLSVNEVSVRLRFWRVRVGVEWLAFVRALLVFLDRSL